MHPMLTIATRAARSAGDIILRSAENIGRASTHHKAKIDLSSEIDRAVEQEIISIIKTAYPDHSIVAEQSGEHIGNEYQWLIDPLDASSNYIQGYPQYAVSIALKQKHKLIVAVIYDPIRDELFSSSRGDGAMLNNRRIRVSSHKQIKEALLGTHLPFKKKQHIDTNMNILKSLITDSADIRCAGTTALSLAYVAAGRIDGYWGIGLTPCDSAAGILMVQEAGGAVTDFEFNDQYFNTGNLIAANHKMHQQIYKHIMSNISKEENKD